MRAMVEAPLYLGACLVLSVRVHDDQSQRTSIIRNSTLLRPYRRTIPTALRWPKGEGLFLMSEGPLYLGACLVLSVRVHDQIPTPVGSP